MTPQVQPRRPRRDEGAVAIITAVMAVLLFVVAALAVELTNAFSRQVAVQSVTDQAARDGAALLPDACAAVLSAAQALAAPANEVPDDRGPLPAVTITSLADIPALLDDDETNGEIRAFGADLDLDGTTSGEVAVSLAGCTLPSPAVAASRLVVVAPPRRVDFALGSLAGADGVAVGGSGTAAIVSAVPLLPFALPAACSADGPHTLVPRLGQVLALKPDPVADDPSAPVLVNAQRQPDGTGLLSIAGGPPVGPLSYWVRFSAQGQPDAYTVSSTDEPDAPGDERSVTASIPPEVSLRPGRWTLRVAEWVPPPAAVPPPGTFFSNGRTIRVRTSPIPFCDTVGPNGQLIPLIPAAGPGGDDVGRVEAATADGLAYSLELAAGGAAAVLAGSSRHNDFADGIEAGLAERLDRASPPCGVAAALPSWDPPGWRVTANNALSCYVTVDGGGNWSVDPAIIDDPRLFMIAVVDPGSSTRDKSDIAVPVTGYRAAFVTDENVQPPLAPSLPCLATDLACNGLQLTVGGLLDRLVIYTFDPALLPETTRVADNGHPFTATPADVMLTN